MTADTSSRPKNKSATAWWEPREIPPGKHLEATLGAMALSIGHSKDEWSMASQSIAEDQWTSRAQVAVRKGELETIDQRFVHAADTSLIALNPLLADRPVVIRPRQTVFLLSGQKVTLYLSTPVWVRITIGESSVTLREIALQRLSDTWFGPSTREGELCYAGRTHARHRVDELPDRPHRAITPLTIHNKAATPLPLEKISLPIPMLALYADEQNKLWTQTVTLTRESETDLASVRIDSAQSTAYGQLTRLAAPRQEGGRSGMTRAFSLLFGSQA